MSKLEWILWGVDFVIGGIGFSLGGVYAGLACFLVGGALILVGFLKKDHDEIENKPEKGSVLYDSSNQPYQSRQRLRKWHKWGAVVSGLCLISLMAYGAAKRGLLTRGPDQEIRTWGHGAKLDFGPFRDVSPPNGKTPFFFNIYMPNTGQLDALNVRHSCTFRLTRKKGEELLPADVDKGMSLAKAGLMYPKSEDVTDRIAVGDLHTWFTANDDFLSIDDFKNVLSSERRLYFWGILEYRDSDSPSGRATFTEFCAYFEGSFSFYHSCDDYNRIYAGPMITAIKQR